MSDNNYLNQPPKSIGNKKVSQETPEESPESNPTQEKPKGQPGRPKKQPGDPKSPYLSQKQVKKKRRPYTAFTPAKKKKFLNALERLGNISSAAAHTNVSRPTIYKLIKENPDFAAAVEIAKGKATFTLEEEAHKLATGRYDKEIYYQGQVVGKEPIRSERMIERLLAAADPERYGNRTNVNMEANVNVTQDSAKDKLASLLKVEGYLEGDYEDISDEDNDG